MPEKAPRDSGDLQRQPPSADQFRVLDGLVEALAPDTTETLVCATTGSSTPSMNVYEVYDENQRWHMVLVASYKIIPSEGDENRTAFVGDMAASSEPTLYYLEQEPDTLVMNLRLERFGLPVYGSCPVAMRVEEALAKLAGANVASDLGLDTASANDAQDLIDLLTLVQTDGRLLG